MHQAVWASNCRCKAIQLDVWWLNSRFYKETRYNIKLAGERCAFSSQCLVSGESVALAVAWEHRQTYSFKQGLYPALTLCAFCYDFGF